MYPSEPFPHFVDDYLAYLHEVFPSQASLDGVHLHDDLLDGFALVGIRHRVATDAHARSERAAGMLGGKQEPVAAGARNGWSPLSAVIDAGVWYRDYSPAVPASTATGDLPTPEEEPDQPQDQRAY